MFAYLSLPQITEVPILTLFPVFPASRMLSLLQGPGCVLPTLELICSLALHPPGLAPHKGQLGGRDTGQGLAYPPGVG